MQSNTEPGALDPKASCNTHPIAYIDTSGTHSILETLFLFSTAPNKRLSGAAFLCTPNAFSSLLINELSCFGSVRGFGSKIKLAIPIL